MNRRIPWVSFSDDHGNIFIPFQFIVSEFKRIPLITLSIVDFL